jgi:sugar/nucleoside kinase (ribokinase family)
VIVFPVAREQWTGYGLAPRRIRSVRTSTTGTYTMSGVPAGDYFIVAVPPARSDAWLDPDFLDRASRTATRVTIAWSGQHRIDLSLSDTIR